MKNQQQIFFLFFFVKSVNLITISGWWWSSHPNVIACQPGPTHGHVVCVHGPISEHSRPTHGPIVVGHGPSRAQGHLIAVHGPSRPVHGPSKWAGRHHIFGTFLQCFFSIFQWFNTNIIHDNFMVLDQPRFKAFLANLNQYWETIGLVLFSVFFKNRFFSFFFEVLGFLLPCLAFKFFRAAISGFQQPLCMNIFIRPSSSFLLLKRRLFLETFFKFSLDWELRNQAEFW